MSSLGGPTFKKNTISLYSLFLFPLLSPPLILIFPSLTFTLLSFSGVSTYKLLGRELHTNLKKDQNSIYVRKLEHFVLNQ